MKDCCTSNQGKVSHSEYRSLLKTGKKIYGKGYFICYASHQRMVVKVGASKRLGGAVMRNRQKRVVRALLRKMTFNGDFLVLIVCLRKNPKDSDPCVNLENSLLRMLRSIVFDYKMPALVSY